MPKVRKGRCKNNGKHVPYVRGFRPPSRKAALLAAGADDKIRELQPHTSFKPITKCTSENDWLAQYCEEAQSFADFKMQCPWLSKRKWKGVKQAFISSGKNLPQKYPDGSIYLLPLGEFDCKSSPDFNNLVEYAQIFFNLPVKTLPRVKLDTTSDTIYCSLSESNEEKINNKDRVKIISRRKDGQYQLNIVSVLQFVGSVAPQDALCTIALTMSDLFEAKSDLFVAGMASGNHRVGVFSFYRYDPSIHFSSEFWYDVTTNKQQISQVQKQRLLLMRSGRLLVHEVAHILGVGHCVYYDCCMNGSGHLQEDFRQSMFLCPVDLHKLSHLCGFDIVKRYRKMRTFFQRFGLDAETKWIDDRLSFIADTDD